VKLFVCIHCHFYQPPRENPWLEAVELQDSAYPYHDWNERITAECYQRNAAARILDSDGRIVEIINNYSRITFNFGPTLLSWTKDNAPQTYEAILEADRESRKRFSGHGSALAQAYNHIIMPLANRRDKQTQVSWGVADFQARFGRDPEGMWLPEAAVDVETLDVLAENGIKFTILAPHQAHRIRALSGGDWEEVDGARIDPTRAYLARLPSGRSIVLFFYDGPVSRAVAFEGLLSSGDVYAQRLMSASSDLRDWDQLIHIATDGESYGHHHRHGEMALAYALHSIEKNDLAAITNYGEYMERFPPAYEVEIHENTAWSCAHGLRRWDSNCGCNSGRPGWNQEWRAPLRAALDWLRDETGPQFEQMARELVRDPWAARDDYIRVVLDRFEENRRQFVGRHAGRELTPEEQVKLWKLLELQRHAMLMYTSCGWFFDELSGIETVQVIQYAGRVVQLAEELFGDSIEAHFLERLAKANSNLPEHGNGAEIYNKFVRPAFVDLHKVGAHYAISSMFESYPDSARIYCYTAIREDYRSMEAGKLRLSLGRARFTSEITQESDLLTFGVLSFGDHNLVGGVRRFGGDKAYEDLTGQMEKAFQRADVPEVIRLLDSGFGGHVYSLKSLFRDEQRRILNLILESTLAEAEASYRQLYEHHAPLMRFLHDLGTPLPKAFQTTAEYALNSRLRREFENNGMDLERIRTLLDEARSANVTLDAPTLEYKMRQSVKRLAENVAEHPDDPDLAHRLEAAVRLFQGLPFQVSLATVQNRAWGLLRNVYPEYRARADNGDEQARQWVDQFRNLAEALRLRVD
jgi:alpha-amylase/alpha-mannosidase (GH57 family)